VSYRANSETIEFVGETVTINRRKTAAEPGIRERGDTLDQMIVHHQAWLDLQADFLIAIHDRRDTPEVVARLVEAALRGNTMQMADLELARTKIRQTMIAASQQAAKPILESISNPATKRRAPAKRRAA
jgi:hypothetical protein